MRADIQNLSDPSIQSYIFKQELEDEKKLLLSTKEIFGVPFRQIADQIASRKKAKTKLPTYYATVGIIYPPSVNLEQCSSEATGNFKAEIIARETNNSIDRVADLTGGFGVDSFFLSRKVQVLDFVEPNTELLNLAQHNHHQLGCTNLNYHATEAEEFLDRCKITYDLIYLDPSRRNSGSKRVFRFAECEPNVNDLLSRIFPLTNFILIKTSPLLDIHQGLNELTHVKKIFVVSVANECKELLFLMQRGFVGEPIIETYNLDKFGTVKQSFNFTRDEEKNTASDFGEPQTYLYEPNASILKAGAFKIIGEKFGLKKLHINTHFYTTGILHENFPGRVFKIEQHEFGINSFVEKNANIITRNYPLTAEELKKKLKLSDGGEWYVIGFSSGKKKYVVSAKRLV